VAALRSSSLWWREQGEQGLGDNGSCGRWQGYGSLRSGSGSDGATAFLVLAFLCGSVAYLSVLLVCSGSCIRGYSGGTRSGLGVGGSGRTLPGESAPPTPRSCLPLAFSVRRNSLYMSAGVEGKPAESKPS